MKTQTRKKGGARGDDPQAFSPTPCAHRGQIKVAALCFFLPLIFELTVAAAPTFQEDWSGDALDSTASQLAKWDLSTLGNSNPQEARIAAATTGRVLRFDPSGGKLIGVESREVFPLNSDITISLVVAIRADSPNTGQAVVFWEDSSDRGTRFQLNVRKDAVQLGSMQSGIFKVLQAAKASISPDGTKILLKLKTTDDGQQHLEVWTDGAQDISVDLQSADKSVPFGSNAKLSLLSQGDGKVDFGPVSISEGADSALP
jgi:hypothetical protein